MRMDETALDLIRKRAKGPVVMSAPMHDHTTMRVGGPADALVCPADREDLARLVTQLGERGIPWLLLGNGSNLIVRDGGIRAR